MDKDIIKLLQLFESGVPDRESIDSTLAVATDHTKWNLAHTHFDRVRRRNLAAIKTEDIRKQCQYCFEEVCLKSLYNETRPIDPFDIDSPHWIAKNALTLARAVGVPIGEVVEILSPSRSFL